MCTNQEPLLIVCIISVLLPSHRTYKLQCPAAISVTANREKEKLVVLKVVSDHNHDVSSEIFKRYPEQRRLDLATEALATTMLDLKVKVKSIQDHIQSQVTFGL